jgi:pilus assembly protein CpaF
MPSSYAMTQHAIHAQLVRSLLAPIADLLDDPEVSEIMVNGHAHVYCERGGRITRATHAFPNDAILMCALRSIAQYAGKTLGPEHPVLEARLPDGSRVQAVVPPAVHGGPSVSIRRFSTHVITLEDLVRRGTLSAEMASYLAGAVANKKNLVVSGGTSSGKTSLLNVLSTFIPDDERVLVLEDARELRLGGTHVVSLETQHGDARGRGRLDMRDLLRASLRMRPDRLVLGEIRGAEALELIQAMTSGHDGCLSTVHASHPVDALARLETMAMMSDVRLPLADVRKQLASGIDIVVQLLRGRDGVRRVTHIHEVHGLQPSGDYEICVVHDEDTPGTVEHPDIKNDQTARGVFRSDAGGAS